jgi:hypothetical protein
VPSIAPSGMTFYTGDRFPQWKNNLFVAALVKEALIRLELDGLELIDTVPRRGAEGPVAFIHPRSAHGVLVELIEAPGGPAWEALGFEMPAG